MQKEEVIVEEINDKPHKEQANHIFNSFLKANKSYEPLKKENIKIPSFKDESVPYLTIQEVES